MHIDAAKQQRMWVDNRRGDAVEQSVDALIEPARRSCGALSVAIDVKHIDAAKQQAMWVDDRRGDAAEQSVDAMIEPARCSCGATEHGGGHDAHRRCEAADDVGRQRGAATLQGSRSTR